jgi:uncharacterized protein (TIGR02217 family)
MAFLDLTFPRDIAAGVTGGPERRVDIVSLSSGEEERNARWKDSRRSWDAGLGLRNVDDLAGVVAMFEECGGQLHSFRFRDWSDHSTAAAAIQTPTAGDQVIGTGDGSETDFQLVKSYGTLTPYYRLITKPIPGTILVALDAVSQGSGWSVDNLTGIVSFVTPPANGVEVTAGFLFDVPVRFDTPRLAVDLAYFSESEGRGLGAIPTIPLIEVKE